jgi:hypothetical protein
MELVKSNIENKIYTIRGVQVMLDSDLAELYNTETKFINRAVKRNGSRFPIEFMFRLTEQEWQSLRFQSGTSSEGHGGRRYFPNVFTEQGIAMLSAVLHTEIAVNVSIQIMKAFVAMRKSLGQLHGLLQRMEGLELKQLNTDQQIAQIFEIKHHYFKATYQSRMGCGSFRRNSSISACLPSAFIFSFFHKNLT